MSQLYTATAHTRLLSLSSTHLSPMLLLLLEWACQSFIVLPMTGPLGLHGVPLQFMRVLATTFYHKWNMQSVRSQHCYDNKEKQISFLVVDLIDHLSHSSTHRQAAERGFPKFISQPLFSQLPMGTKHSIRSQKNALQIPRSCS
mgnify:CR=1 FL=1